MVTVSIHAPREGSDPRRMADRIKGPGLHSCFNPRPPRGERPSKGLRLLFWPSWFQSTPPARGATFLLIRVPIHAWYQCPPIIGATLPAKTRLFQSTPPARGATWKGCLLMERELVSIHAPREGSDHDYPMVMIRSWKLGGLFQSTPPARGATG